MLVLLLLFVWPIAFMYFLLGCERLTRHMKIIRRRKKWNTTH